MQKPSVCHYTKGDKILTVTFQLSAACNSFTRCQLWKLEQQHKVSGFPEINESFGRLLRGAVLDVCEGKPFTNSLTQGFSEQAKAGTNTFTVRVFLPQDLANILDCRAIKRVAESPTLQVLAESLLLGSPVLRALDAPQQSATDIRRSEGSADIGSLDIQ